MPYNSYEEVIQLDTNKQRGLLQKGDAPERVWAAWSLGVEFGKRSVPDLFEGLNESPDPGTRRHLLVILAGFGEREILRVFAQDDPDEYVRATACQYLIRIAEENDTSTQLLIRDRLLLDTSSVVRSFILREATPEFLALQVEQLVRLIDDSNLEVRQYVVDYLLVTAPLSQLFPGVLADRIPNEADYDLRQRLFQLCLEAGSEKRLVLVGQNYPPDYKIEVLQFLVDNQLQFGWELLKPFSIAADPRLDIWLIKLLAPSETINALPWLINIIARATDWPRPQNRPEAEIRNSVTMSAIEAQQRMIACIEQIRITQTTEIDQQIKSKAVMYFQSQIVGLELELRDSWDSDEEEIKLAIQEIQQLISVLESK
jgi:hypothetical protein